MNKHLLLVLLPLISFRLTAGTFSIEYLDAQGTLKQIEVEEKEVRVRFDKEFYCESYDPETKTLHISPGRLI